ncbi:adhesion G protein-coupled receptor L2-like isoform X2 [Stylophora pistillata]|uniref:Putative G-protein coupled receptor 133 n=1 Tax=Stylophora pistillata TaxID=50429 RepID=A0A2B4SIK7_STYPI|nr:adhesion G protein-coupled receptor L2-like isoform X2 [Stylophora pistillata]XP_022786123.1 adhesion G protein-coupled receptor L2-like isoform X2 [Stylophora pistillata]PFX28285.1 putative G-protein coupled receptor 133 [Stylophora pistillata]
MKSRSFLFIFLVQVILPFSSLAEGPDVVLGEKWLNINGTEIKDLTSNPRYLKNADKSSYFSLFKDYRPNEKYNNHGARYRSYLLAQETGNYTFYTFCDDSCRLYLSIDVNPRNKKEIIDQTKNVPIVNEINCCSKLEECQISPPQYLEESRLHYIELLFKQGIGNSRMFVAMKTPSGHMVLPINSTHLVKQVPLYDIPGHNCKTEGDPRYPVYVNCTAFSDTQRVDSAVSLLRDLRSRVNNDTSPTDDFLHSVMKTAGKRTSDLLEDLENIGVNQNASESNLGFTIAREVERLGESIASRVSNDTPMIAVDYSSLDMKAGYGNLDASFESSILSSNSESKNSITISMGDSTQGKDGTRFFSAFYRSLGKVLQINISHVYSNESSQQVPYFLNSKIISGSVVHDSEKSFTGQVTIRLEHTQFKSLEYMSMECAFWRFPEGNAGKSSGYWSTDGCNKDEELSNAAATVCHCHHLTHFGILMRVTDDTEVTQPGQPHVQALQLITYIGCGLSLLGEILTFVAIMCLKLTKSETSIIHLNLVAALAVAQITFLTGIEATQNKAACKIVAVLLHYFNLVSFCWMLVEGVWLYLMIVRVFETGHSRIKKYCACAWGFPFVFVVITLSASFDGYGTERSCWLSVQKGTIWSFVVPVILIALANSIVLGMVVKEILRLNHPTTENGAKYQSARSGVQSAIVLLPLLGITWLFGVLTFNSNTLVFQYLFAIFNSIQGFFIFLFHCLLNSEVRRAFQRKKKIWSESHDAFQTHSMTPQNYNDISKETLSTGNDIGRPGSAVSAKSDLSHRP